MSHYPESAQQGEGGLLRSLFTDQTTGFYLNLSQRHDLSLYFTHAGWTGYEGSMQDFPSLSALLDTRANGHGLIDVLIVEDTTGGIGSWLGKLDHLSIHIRVLLVLCMPEQASVIARNLTQQGLFLARQQGHILFFCDRMVDALSLKYRRMTYPPETKKRSETTCRITDNVLCQQPEQPLATLFDFFPETPTPTAQIPALLHIINPYPGTGTLYPTTLDAIQCARKADNTRAQLAAVIHRDDQQHKLPPTWHTPTPCLQRYVGAVHPFKQQRPFPMLFDILQCGASVCPEDGYLIYTNLDICPCPHFYLAIRELIAAGFDAITINRRTVSRNLSSLSLPYLSASEPGYVHPGFDCFIFSRRLFQRFITSHVCIGVAAVARSLLYNMVCFADNMIMLKNIHLTYHIGDDTPWQSDSHREYSAFNHAENRKLLNQLANTHDLGRTRLRQFCQQHGERYNVQENHTDF